MANTRNYKSPGIFANNAQLVIPNPPVEGVAYRNINLTRAQTEQGWRTLTLESMSLYNQILYEYGSIINAVDSQGLLGWSDSVNYETPALVFGSDNNLYFSLLPSGPDNGGAQDPISTVGVFWDAFVTSAQVLTQIANEDRTTAPTGSDLVGYSDAANANQSTLTDAIVARPTSAVLYDNTGAGLIGTTSGVSVQAALNRIPFKVVACCRTLNEDNNPPFTNAINIANITTFGGINGQYQVTFTNDVGTNEYMAFATANQSNAEVITTQAESSAGIQILIKTIAGNAFNRQFSLVIYTLV